MIQQLEIYKAKDGVTAQEVRDVLKYGERLIGPDYLGRMKEVGLLGDISFVAEIKNEVYLISVYIFAGEPRQPSAQLKSIPSLRQYMEKIEPLFEGALPVRLDVANSFWVDAVIKEQLG